MRHYDELETKVSGHAEREMHFAAVTKQRRQQELNLRLYDALSTAPLKLNQLTSGQGHQTALYVPVGHILLLVIIF
jgi:hypothetical protein